MNKKPGDDAWTMEMVNRIQSGAAKGRQRRDELAAAIDDLADGFTKLGMGQWRHEKTSEARADANAGVVALGDRTETVSRIVKYESTLNILSAADQLRGFSVLLRAEASLMGAVSVSRGVFEACLWATAVIDPTILPGERLQRALARRLARLSAAVRLKKFLGTDLPNVTRYFDGEHGDDEDVHGSNRDPSQDIQDIVTFAKSRGWTVQKGRRAYEINQPLTIDWLVENLERRVGVEGYAWTSSSSMAHGEHAADTASWVELSQDIGSAPAWLIRQWSTGVWAGPRLFSATFAAYTGRIRLKNEYNRFDRVFWDA